MRKVTHLFTFVVILFLLSCDKKVVYPSISSATSNEKKYSGDIFTVAGNGYPVSVGGGYTGNGGPATDAELDSPTGVVVDALGNIYIADGGNCLIRKVNTSGIISTYAGVEHVGYSGDGGPATAAELQFPYGLAIDKLGNLYIADNGNNCIRMVTIGGIISTFAGNGTKNYSGDGGPATAAELALPYGVAIDGLGNVYIADFSNNRIRKVNTNGIISTIAGNGFLDYSGDGGPATLAEINIPQGVAVDASGNVYIADYGNNRIRKIDTCGIISTFAGNGYNAPFDRGYSGDGGDATSAEIYNPTDIKVDGSGNIYIADYENERIRIVNLSGIISTVAGDGIYGYSGDGGLAISAEMGYPQGIAVDGSSNLFIADPYLNRVRIVYK